MSIDLVHQVLSDAFPARCETASVEYVEVEALDKPRDYGVTFRLIMWDVDARTNAAMIRDVKEQRIYLALPDLEVATLARFNELVRGLVSVLNRALAHTEIETLMPHDLVNFSPMKLVKAASEADFVAAYSVKSRLGRYLPNPG